MKIDKNLKIIISLYLITIIAYFIGLPFLKSGDEMGYAILNYYLIMPVVSFIVGIFIFLKIENNIIIKLIYPIFCGVLGFTVSEIAFSNNDSIMFVLTLVPAVIGLLVGLMIKKFKK